MTDYGLGPESKLLSYLPGIFQDGEAAEQERLDLDELQLRKHAEPRRPFLGRYLLPFEKILLSGDLSLNIVGLETTIARISRLFVPFDSDGAHTPEDFLPWLARWGAFTLRADLSEHRKRQIVESIISLYPLRGTRKYLLTLLKWTLDVEADVIDRFPSFVVGHRSTVGVDSYIGGAPAHYFRVIVKFRNLNREGQDRQLEIARQVIELAKPAHTVYDIEAHHPRFRINAVSTVGVDTYL